MDLLWGQTVVPELSACKWPNFFLLSLPGCGPGDRRRPEPQQEEERRPRRRGGDLHEEPWPAEQPEPGPRPRAGAGRHPGAQETHQNIRPREVGDQTGESTRQTSAHIQEADAAYVFKETTESFWNLLLLTLVLSAWPQMIAANVLSKEEFPDFDDETGILPKVDDEEGKKVFVLHQFSNTVSLFLVFVQYLNGSLPPLHLTQINTTWRLNCNDFCYYCLTFC